MSIKACSGEYARNHNNISVIFSSDTIYYRCDKFNCYCLTAININFHLNRILAVEKDYIKTTSALEIIKLIINSLYSMTRFKIDQLDYSMSFQSTIKELFLSKNEFHHVF